MGDMGFNTIKGAGNFFHVSFRDKINEIDAKLRKESYMKRVLSISH
jgi:hypothetical protein